MLDSVVFEGGWINRLYVVCLFCSVCRAGCFKCCIVDFACVRLVGSVEESKKKSVRGCRIHIYPVSVSQYSTEEVEASALLEYTKEVACTRRVLNNHSASIARHLLYG